jgi:diacylglycerol kinase (ATP)
MAEKLIMTMIRLASPQEAVPWKSSGYEPVSVKRWKRFQVILNPASAAGKTGKRQIQIMKAIQRFAGKGVLVTVTQKPLEAERLTRRAIWQGYELIIAVGGDGTIQEVVNGFFHNGEIINRDCHLGIISSGTGQGLARSLGLPLSLEDQLQVIFNGRNRIIDIGRITFTGCEPGTSRCFVNEFQAGIGGEVVTSMKSGQKKLGGLLGFGINTFLTGLSYNADQLQIVIDDKTTISGKMIGLVVANGAITAGGMNLVPAARLDDGRLDLLLIHNQSVLKRFPNFFKLYAGKHIRQKEFSHHRIQKLEIYGEPDVRLAADGEQLPSLPCRVEVIPSAINIKGNI